jgi:hypothetical protein|tara:strand:- start:978 stop:1157 length:180 start_codon:yes stop_codon:yes gene_type:complete
MQDNKKIEDNLDWNDISQKISNMFHLIEELVETTGETKFKLGNTFTNEMLEINFKKYKV